MPDEIRGREPLGAMVTYGRDGTLGGGAGIAVTGVRVGALGELGSRMRGVGAILGRD